MRIRAVAVVIDDGDVLLIDRRKDGRAYSVLPGGGVESGETIEDACLREGGTSSPRRRATRSAPPRYTWSMTTTIKVSDELRDRLKAQAARDGLTLGAHLAQLADAEDRRRRLQSLKAAIAQTPPAGAKSHVAESAEWERAELADTVE